VAEPIHLIRVDATLADELVRGLATPHPALHVLDSAASLLEKISASRAPRAVITLTDARQLEPGWLRDVRARNAAAQVLVVARECSDETWRRLMLCGAAGVLRPPWQNLDLEAELASEPLISNLFRRHDGVTAHGKAMLRYTLPSNTEYVLGIVHMVALLAMEFGFPPADYTMNLPLAVDEALTNAIVHGNAKNPSKNVEVELMIDAHMLRLRVTDQGRGFRSENRRDPLDPNNLMTASGRGVYLIEQLMDEVQWTREGCCIEMVKRKRVR
jgi:serine/threonine-protein kinase RsbW